MSSIKTYFIHKIIYNEITEEITVFLMQIADDPISYILDGTAGA